MDRPNLKWLISIVPRGRGTVVSEIMKRCGVQRCFMAQGRGTASSEIQQILGLGEPEKEIVMGLAPASSLGYLLPRLREELELAKAGRGIAFTLPLSGISLAAYNSALGAENRTKEEVAMQHNPIDHDLVVAVVDSGNSDLVFDAAREAGCRGGTIAKAREVAPAETRKLFGLTILPEKEVVLIVVSRAEKQDILKAICNKILQETGEHGLVFSLPVADAVGLAERSLHKSE